MSFWKFWKKGPVESERRNYKEYLRLSDAATKYAEWKREKEKTELADAKAAMLEKIDNEKRLTDEEKIE